MRKWIGIFLIAAVCAAVLLMPQYLWHATVFYVFQTRDLLRADRLLRGQMIFWGPEMTGGGNLPGPFYYFLLAIPQMISRGWQSAWVCLQILNCMCSLIGFYAFRRAGLKAAACIWLAGYALAPKTAFFATEFYNVSYMAVFIIGSLIAMQAAFTHSSARVRRIAALTLFALSGLALQLHFTAIVIPAAFLLTYVLRKRLLLVAPEATEVACGGLVFVGLLLPYIFWLTSRHFGFNFGQEFEFAGDPQEAPLKIVSLIFERKGQLGFENLLWELKMAVPVAFPALVGSAIWLKFKRGVSEPTRTTPYLNLWPLAIAALCALIPALDRLISPQAHRYSMPLYLTLLAISALLFERLLRSGERKALLIFALGSIGYTVLAFGNLLSLTSYFETPGWLGLFLEVAAILVLAAVAASHIAVRRPLQFSVTLLFLALALTQSRPMLARSEAYQRPMPTLWEWNSIWSRFKRLSNLDYEQAINRIYFVNHHREQDPEISFKLHERSGDGAAAPETADGYFISAFFPGGNVREWLLKTKLQEDLLSGLKQNAISLELQEPVQAPGVLVVGYKILDPSYTRHFHNTGEGYYRSLDSRLLDGLKTPEGTARLENGDLLFKWNGCSNHVDYCSTGAVVHVEKIAPDRYTIRARVIGSPLSQSSPWIHPEWTEAWIAPYLEVECGAEKHRFNLLSSIGYRRELGIGVVRVMGANHSLIAPSEYEFHENCSQTITKISVGRQSTVVEQINQIVQFPATELSLNLVP